MLKNVQETEKTQDSVYIFHFGLPLQSPIPVFWFLPLISFS